MEDEGKRAEECEFKATIPPHSKDKIFFTQMGKEDRMDKKGATPLSASSNMDHGEFANY